MIAAFEKAVVVEGLAYTNLMILSAIGALIGTVGLSTFAIVAAIRNLPRQP